MWWIVLATQMVGAGTQDSLGVARAARHAQARFESYRIDHLPWTDADGRAEPCDERVGRFCFWYDPSDAWRPAPEAPAIQRARLELVRALDSLAALLPGDGWIAGQRVRYLVDAGDTAAAMDAARACRAAAWWCAALAGYALHEARRYATADSAFGAALAAMPAERRCRWTDLSVLLDDLRGTYHRLSCAGRDSLARRIWWLADPLYLVPGNERRTEHFARHVLNALQDDARPPDGVRWEGDSRELLLRYGWPAGYERERPSPVDIMEGNRSVMAHFAPHSRDFMPPARFVLSPDAIRQDAWDLDPARPVSSYAPPYATTFHELPHQVAVFRRADAIVVVASYDVRAPEDSAAQAERIRQVQAALVLQRSPEARRVMVRGTGATPTGVLLAFAPAESTLVSLETLDTADSTRAARARFWLPVTPHDSGVTLSDPLLFRVERPDSLPSSLPEAVGAALGSAGVDPGERVGVFWETYGLASHPEPFRVTLTLTRESASFLRRIAEWTGLARPEDRYVSLSWDEPPVGSLVYPRALALALPGATPGRYVLEITLKMQGQPIAATTRNIVIESEK